jgi:hypothetical protein
MPSLSRIDQELAAAEAAWNENNEGKARVCARRAVAGAHAAWLERHADRPWSGDAMAHLRRIQQDASLPVSIREAAERLSTAVTQQQTMPFTIDPVSDAKLIIAHLSAGPTAAS